VLVGTLLKEEEQGSLWLYLCCVHLSHLLNQLADIYKTVNIVSVEAVQVLHFLISCSHEQHGGM